MLPIHDKMWILYKNTIPVNKVKVAIKIPRMNPVGIKYKRWWKIHKRRCIEGYWVTHDNRWKFVPGPVYFFVNFWKILLTPRNSRTKTKKIGIPFLRDLEWVKGYLYEEARGFSGFEDDPIYTCHTILKDIDPYKEPELLDTELMIYGNPEYIKSTLVSADGRFKTYIPARDYLRLYFKRDMGKPLYFNMSYNIVDIESRGGGKSYFGACVVGHNFIFDGAVNYDDYLTYKGENEPLSSESLIGAIDAKYSSDIISKVKLGLENMPGKIRIGDVIYPSPFHKEYSGDWGSAGTVTSGYDKKIGGIWEKVGTKSKIQHRSFAVTHTAANGTRPNLAILEEVGFMGNLVEVLGQMKEAAADGTVKQGIIWKFGCVCAGTKVWTKEGRLLNIEDVIKGDGILGYDGGNTAYKEDIVWMKPPENKPCYRIETTGGNYIECSNDHPILKSSRRYKVDRGSKGTRQKVTFTAAENIVKGDYLFMCDTVGNFGKKTLDNARVIGLLIGDGNYSKGSGITLSCGDPEIEEFVRKIYPKGSDSKEFIQKNGKKYSQLGLIGLRKQLKELGIYGQVKQKKRLPENIHKYTKQSIADLIGGYIDADGSVNYSKKKNTVRVVLTSAVFELLEEVKYQLMKFGINANIVKEYRKGGFKPGVIYRLYITKYTDVVRVQKEITLLCNHKQNVLNKILTIKKSSDRRIPRAEFILNTDNNKGKFFEGRDDLTNLRYELVKSVEYIGEKPIYNMHTGHSNTYLSNGFITKQTGGDMAGGSTEAVKQVFYSPEAFDCLAFDDEYEGYQSKIGFFVPAWMTLNQFKDPLGNTNWKASYGYLIKVREELKRNVKKKKRYEDELVQRPLVHSEAFLDTNTNILPVADLKEHMDSLLAMGDDPNIVGRSGWMYLTPEGDPMFKLDSNRFPTDYPVKATDDNSGAVVVWENPVEEAEYGWYVGGLDPYDFDIAPNSLSLGSVFIIRRATPLNGGFDRIVAEYTGRPLLATDFYEQTRRLSLWYGGANILYENEKQMIKDHYKKMYSIGLLAYTPGVLKANETSKTAKTRIYGQHMSVVVKREAEIYLREWLLTPIGDGKLQLQTIKSIPLLKELISYNEDGNFDRVISIMLGVIQLIQFRTVIVEEEKEKVEQEAAGSDFFDRRLFASNVRTRF